MEPAEQETQVMGEPSTEARLGEGANWSWKRWTLVGAVILLVAAGVGTGAYFYGESTGEDLDAARAAGTEAGQEEGAATGAEQGYAEGFKDGRKQGYERSYDEAYKTAYRKAFEEAGLEEPENIEVPQS